MKVDVRGNRVMLNRGVVEVVMLLDVDELWNRVIFFFINLLWFVMKEIN